MIRYKVRYKQNYRGEILEDTYFTFANSEEHMKQKIEALYSDPCVFEVEYEKLPNQEVIR